MKWKECHEINLDEKSYVLVVEEYIIGMDLQYSPVHNYMMANDLQLDNKHFDRRHQGKDPDIFSIYRPLLLDNLNLKYIPVDNLRMDSQCNPEDMYKNPLHFVLYI